MQFRGLFQHPGHASVPALRMQAQAAHCKRELWQSASSTWTSSGPRGSKVQLQAFTGSKRKPDCFCMPAGTEGLGPAPAAQAAQADYKATAAIKQCSKQLGRTRGPHPPDLSESRRLYSSDESSLPQMGRRRFQSLQNLPQKSKKVGLEPDETFGVDLPIHVTRNIGFPTAQMTQTAQELGRESIVEKLSPKQPRPLTPAYARTVQHQWHEHAFCVRGVFA